MREDQPNSHVKLGDFTTARHLEARDELCFDCVGTAGFRGPEMQFSSHGYLGQPTDVWGLGICMYVFFNGGVLPWWSDSELELDIAAKNNEIQFNPALFSKDLIDLITRMCQKHQKDRIDLRDI